MKAGSRFTIVVAVAAAALGMAAAVAIARNNPTEISIKLIDNTPMGNKFGGKVTSSKAGCKSDRKVVLHNHPNFGPDQGKDIKIGSDTTGSSGAWKIKSSPRPNGGNVWATVKDDGKCDRAKSKNIYFGP